MALAPERRDDHGALLAQAPFRRSAAWIPTSAWRARG
jgi:hypothetical protein